MHVLRRLLFSLAALVLLLGLVDIGLRLISEDKRLPFAVVDIETYPTLRAKLMDLQERRGIKVAVFGDSVVYGASMAKVMGPEWRGATLDRVLETRLRSSLGRDDVYVLNLGMNGLLYSDMESLTRLLEKVGVNAYIFNVSLRSFSADFSGTEEAVTRPWLKTYADAPSIDSAVSGSPLDRFLDEMVARYWYAYRIKDLVKFRVFGAQPKNVLADLHSRFNSMLGQTNGAPDDPLLLLLKIKRRYARIDLSGKNAQWQSFNTMLDELKSTGKPVLAFYSTENPQIAGKIANKEHLETMRATIAKTIEGRALYLPPLADLRREHFVDNFHLTSEGTQLLGDALAKMLLPEMTKRRDIIASP